MAMKKSQLLFHLPASRRLATLAAALTITTCAQAQWLTSGSNTLHDNTGNVGIGVLLPSQKLDVDGSVNLSAGNALRIGGANAVHMNGTENVAIGQNAGNSLTSGLRNAFIGTGAGRSLTTGQLNAFVGYGSGEFATTASFNALIGYQTGRFLTTGSQNTFIGLRAGYNTTTGANNVAIGSTAGFSLTTSGQNVLIGRDAGYFVTVGNANTMLGWQAGTYTVEGADNTFIGRRAGFTNTSGTGNTYIGRNTGGTPDLTNATAIGANASVTQSNSVVLGNAANVGIGTSAPTSTLHVVGGMRLVDGNQAEGKVLVSDENGNAAWSDGPAGPMGETGPTGAQGPTGPTGDAGPQGLQGETGPTGPQGTEGIAGADGVDGRTILNGFSTPSTVIGEIGDFYIHRGANLLFGPKTEFGWMSSSPVSLVGPAGATGATGAAGPTGANGANGTDGVTGPTGPAGDPAPADNMGNHQMTQNLQTKGFYISRDGANNGLWLDTDGNASLGSILPIAGAQLTMMGNINQIGNEMIIGAKGSNVPYGPRTLQSVDPEAIGNVAVGADALTANTTGSNNVAVGRLALNSNNVGFENTAVGFLALNTNGTGATLLNHSIYNTAVGSQALQLNTTGYQNTAVGHQSLEANTTGFFNSALGKSSLTSNTTGQRNSAIGYAALQDNTTGSWNTASGIGALGDNTTGSFNTSNGALALLLNTTGSENTAVGAWSLYNNSDRSNLVAVGDSALHFNGIGASLSFHATSNTAVGSKTLLNNTTGYGNTANGFVSMYSNTTGYRNTAIGRESMPNNTTGHHSTALGYQSLNSNSTGANNTAVGAVTLTSNTTGSFNTAIGRNADVSTGNLSNASALGRAATVNASNKVRIANTTTTVIEGQVAYSFPSDQRFKSDVDEDAVKGLEFITKLRPVNYKFDTEKFDAFLLQNLSEDERKARMAEMDYEQSKNIVHTGFLAQEVAAAAEEVGYDFDGVHIPVDANDNYSVSYSQFVVPIVKAIQEQQEQIEALRPAEVEALKQELTDVKAENAAMKAQMDEILSRLSAFDTDLQQCCFSFENGTSGQKPEMNDTPALEQNFPNPFNENTVIKYYLPHGTRTANIVVSDLNGVQLKSFDLNGSKGAGQIMISGGAFAAGTYIYTLTVDGKRIDSKRMVLM
jgi:trimeric autotransporter adhesin